MQFSRHTETIKVWNEQGVATKAILIGFRLFSFQVRIETIDKVQRFFNGRRSSSHKSEADQRRLRASSFTLRFSGCVWGGAEVGRLVLPEPAACLRGTKDTHTSPTWSLCTRRPYCAIVRSGLHDAHPLPYTKNGCSTVDSSSTWKNQKQS